MYQEIEKNLNYITQNLKKSQFFIKNKMVDMNNMFTKK